MREAIGGSWLIYFLLTFIYIYVGFIATIMNYASAYRATNYVVSTIENTEGKENLDDLKKSVEERYKYFDGIDIECRSIASVDGTIYLVTSHVKFEIPLTGIKFSQPVRVESKTIYNTTCP